MCIIYNTVLICQPKCIFCLCRDRSIRPPVLLVILTINVVTIIFSCSLFRFYCTTTTIIIIITTTTITVTIITLRERNCNYRVIIV